MTIFQALVDGLATGATYAVLALAFSALWATIRTVNLALIQVVAVGGYGAYLGGSVGGIGMALLVGVLIATVVGLLSHYIAVAPTLSRGQVYPMIATLGVGLLVQAGLAQLFGDDLLRVPPLLPQGGLTVAGVYIAWNTLTVLVVVVALMLTAAAVMRFTSLGLAFRSTAWSSELASAYGVNLAAVRFSSAAVASALAGLAGVSIVILAGSVSPILGSAAALKGMVAMLIGGAGNLPGAVIGGLAVGLAESASSLVVPSALGGAVSFVLLLIIMIVRPSGILKEY